MPFLGLLPAALCLLIWLYLTLVRGAFWRLRPFDDDLAKHMPPETWPCVVAVIPARNEAEAIAQTLTALFQQDYPGEFSVVLIDDHSEDATSHRAQQAALQCDAVSRLTIHAASALPPGWTGKLWALHEGISKIVGNAVTRAPALSSRAERGICFSPSNSNHSTGPTYFWFTDADIVHAPDTLRCLVARAEQNQLDLTSLMVLLQVKTAPERALIPAFLYFFLQLYPPRWIANPTARMAGAAGGCILLRHDALDRIGGFATIRSEVIDDCALAAVVKRGGGHLWMGLTRKSVSLRSYRTFAELRDLIARTAFTQLNYSSAILLGTIAALFLTYLAPIVLLFAHHPATRLLALAAWLLMSLTFLPTIRFYRLSPLRSISLPLIAMFYSYATCVSAVRYYLRRGAQWKGRSQAPKPA